MSTLHDSHVSSTSEYVTGKCERCDKILCNQCPLKHEGRIGSEGWDALRDFARMRKNTVRRPTNQGWTCIYIFEINTWIYSMDTVIQMIRTIWRIHGMGATIQMKRIICESKIQGMVATIWYRRIIINLKSQGMVTTIRVAETCVKSWMTHNSMQPESYQIGLRLLCSIPTQLKYEF